ncbi:MAG: cyclase family protein [Sphaerochaeta sp.]
MISLSLLGIRFDQFPPDVHTLFSFSDEQLKAITLKVRKQTRSDATLVLSTCDRIELWCENPKVSLEEPVLRALSLPVLTWRTHTYRIAGDDVLDHLFSLSCGLLSPLFGEDQIISQLQISLQRSRLIGCASAQMEYLFREAITTAKAVQSQVDLQKPEQTLCDAVEALLLERGEEKRVLVIGSSAQARLVSSHLAQRGYQVCMTFRDLEKADLLLPKGVQALSYDDRLSLFPQYPVVISATKGMEYTVESSSVEGPHLFIDLAPVRDIDPELAKRNGVKLFSLEDFSVPLPFREEATQQARAIINKAKQQVLLYLSYRQSVETIQHLATQAASDLVFRLNRQLESSSLGPAFPEVLYETARKVFSHQLYEMRKKEAGSKHYDLSMRLESAVASYPSDPDTIVRPYHTIDKEGWRLTQLSLGSHSGTHMDSPSHLLKDGKSLDQYPLSRFFATAYVLDCRGMHTVREQDIPPLDKTCDAILFYTGGTTHLLPKTAQMLLERGIRLFGFDAPNCDVDGDLSFPVHHALFNRDALILENLTNLDLIVSRMVDLICLPLSFKDADGSPTRVVAIEK